MSGDAEMIQIINAIYKYVFENPATHRNVIKKELIKKGKVSAKAKFTKVLDSLLTLGTVFMEKEKISLNLDILKLGVLQKNGEEYYVVTPNSNKHYKINKNVAAGFKCGDLLDIIISSNMPDAEVLVLGKSKNTFTAKQEINNSNAGDPLRKFVNLDAQNFVLGRVIKISHDQLVFIPNKKSFPIRQIPILNRKEDFAKFQDRLCVMNLLDLEAPLLGGYIVKVKGDAGNPIHEYDAIAEMYGAIMNWSDPQIRAEIEKIPTSVNANDFDRIDEAQAQHMQRGRVVDLRHLGFTTVDPSTCKDMDDAIYTTFDKNGDLVCYTAVANVTKYVNLDSEIGRRYINGAFTIYAPNKAYNILPTELSTGICSLNPNEDRLAFVIKYVIDKSTGKVKSSNIYDAIINSKQKYSYEQAQEIVDKTQPIISKQDLFKKHLKGEALTLEEQVLLNYYAGQTIKIGFDQRKMIRFVANKEREIVFDDALEDVVDIKEIAHLYYHEVIEAFMVTANEATAKYAKDNNLNNIYRTHDEPNPKKIKRANEFFNILGIDFEGDLSAEGTRNLIDIIRDTANEEIINKFLIKMQSRAIYSERLYSDKKDDPLVDWLGERISHYALQSPHYSHTTSPIRRVPDYVTQYNILAHIHGTAPLSGTTIQNIVEIANEMQIQVDQAEKDFEDISSVLYCEKHIGEVMSGRVSKIRYTSSEEGYEDDIIVIVKNETKGISVEIPLSQVLGRSTVGCEISEERCAVYDARGNSLLTLCRPVDFIIEKADRKTMTIVGKTSKELLISAEEKARIEQLRRTNERRHLSLINKENRNKRIEAKRKYNANPNKNYNK